MIRHLLSLLVLSAIAAGSQSAFAQEDPLGGASRPKPQMELDNRDRQYKRIHQFALRLMQLHRFDEAEKFLNDHLQDFPGDPESTYMLGLLSSRLGNANQAAEYMQEAIELGLDPGRVVAGPRGMTQGAARHPYFRGLIAEHATRPVHGPLVGNVTDTSASIWVRTALPSKIEVVAHPVSDPSVSIRSEQAASTNLSDFTAVTNISGLEPETEYTFEVVIDGETDGAANPMNRIRTFPTPGTSYQFRLAFGGGAGYVPPHERMWTTIESFDPHALLLLGDNTYIDDPQSIIMQQYTYQRRQSRPEFRQLTGRTAVFSIWDDHDFGTNDCWGGPTIDTPFWKKNYAFVTWRQNWPNPGFAGGDEQPGCWYSFSLGDVDFIMLDCRYYRTSPRIENPSMLGPVQLKWFEETLKASTGRFKVLCSSVPWDFRTKGDSLDTWNGFKDEREKIFQIIEQNRIEGVLLMSADRHRSDAWHIERENSYGFYEFNSSRLTNQHVHPTMEKAGAIFSYNAKQSFGLVTFDTTADDPTVTYEVINIDGEKIDALTVKHSQLTFD